MEEIWKVVEGYKNYQVSNLGNVKSMNYGGFGYEKLMIPTKDTKGYNRITFSKNNVKSTKKVHRLIAQSFVLNTENKPQVNHINGIKTDNYVGNLEWCDNGENGKHAYDTGLRVSVKGIKHHSCKLTEQQVLEIRNIKNGLNNVEIGKIYGVYKTTIRLIRNGTSWKHLK